MLCRKRTSFRHSSRADRNADRLAVPQGDKRAMFQCPHDRQSLCRHCRRIATRSARRCKQSAPEHLPPAPSLGRWFSAEQRTHRPSLRTLASGDNPSPIGHSHRSPTTVYPLSPSPSARICAPSRALRSLLAKMLRTSLTQGAATIACIRARPRSLSGQSGIGTLGLITTSGWVMKKTDGMGLRGRTEQLDCNFSSAPGGDKDG